MASAPLHLAVIAIVVLCLALNANAQNLTASIQPQNLTAYKQAVSNFSGSVREPSFPCGSGSSGLVGGYKELDLDSNENLNDVELLINDVYDFFLSATVNVTNCAAPYYPLINLTSACSQVTTPPTPASVIL